MKERQRTFGIGFLWRKINLFKNLIPVNWSSSKWSLFSLLLLSLLLIFLAFWTFPFWSSFNKNLLMLFPISLGSIDSKRALDWSSWGHYWKKMRMLLQLCDCSYFNGMNLHHLLLSLCLWGSTRRFSSHISSFCCYLSWCYILACWGLALMSAQ